MADQIGAVEFPPDDPGNTPIPDPLLDKLGPYLESYLNVTLSKEWARLTPGSARAVAYTAKGSTTRAWFNDSRLPTLFLFRHRTRPRRIADDIHRDMTQVYAVWVAPQVDQAQRERRDPFFARIGTAIEHVILQGRHPDWVDTGDEDATAATRGSVLVDRLCLGPMPEVTEINFEPNIRIEVAGEKRVYDAVMVTIELEEMRTRDPAAHGVESKLTNTTSQGDGAFTVIRQYGL